MARPDHLIGKKLGRYRIDALLGHGHAAHVYRATDPVFQRTVAIKVLDSHDPAVIAAFLRDAEAVKRLSHPHILPIYDAAERDGVAFLVRQHTDSGTLRGLLQRAGALDPPEAAAILRPIATALDYAHRQGFIHGNLKPSNILLTGEGTVFVTDFIVPGNEGRQRSTVSTLIGATDAPEYVSPEQARGLPLDRHSDLYVLGVILYEAIAGRAPFHLEGPTDTARAVIARHWQQEPPRPGTLRPGLSPAVEEVLLRGLAKLPEQRHPTGAALFFALGEALEQDRGESLPRLVLPEQRDEALRATRLAPAVAPPPAPGGDVPQFSPGEVAGSGIGSATPVVPTPAREATLPVEATPAPAPAQAAVAQVAAVPAAADDTVVGDGPAPPLPAAAAPAQSGAGADAGRVCGQSEAMPDPDDALGTTVQTTPESAQAPERPPSDNSGSPATSAQARRDEKPAVAPAPAAQPLPAVDGQEARTDQPPAIVAPRSVSPPLIPGHAEEVFPRPLAASSRRPSRSPGAAWRYVAAVLGVLLIGIGLLSMAVLRDDRQGANASTRNGPGTTVTSPAPAESPIAAAAPPSSAPSATAPAPAGPAPSGTNPGATATPAPATRQEVIVFAGQRNGETATTLQAITPDGQQRRPLAQVPGQAWGPQIARDSRAIVYSVGGNKSGAEPLALAGLTGQGQHDLYLTITDGSAPVRLTTGAWNAGWSWSPDGATLAFASDRDGNWEIYTLSFPSGAIARLTNSPARDAWPTWSPDGKRIVFMSTRDGLAQLYSMKPDGSGIARLFLSESDDSFPAFSPDGSKIAFVSSPPGTREADIFVIDADGGNATRLTTTGDNSQPTWSPDGTRIAFVSTRAGGYNLFVMRADGSLPTQLTRDAGAVLTPTWGYLFLPPAAPAQTPLAPLATNSWVVGALLVAQPRRRRREQPC